jgi:hypothetical protein
MKNLIRIFLIIIFVSVSAQYSKAEEDIIWNIDNRLWKEGYQHKQEDGTIISEFVLPGETSENCSELVSIQRFYGQQNIKLEEFVETLEQKFKKICPGIKWAVFNRESNTVMYEFLVKDCSGQDNQQELARIIRGKEGIWVLHYSTKRTPMSLDKRKEWINNLKSASLSEEH